MTRRFLDVSSGHLSPATWRWLDDVFADHKLRDELNGAAAELAGGRTRYGWFVYAREDPDDITPADLQAVMAEARKHGAAYVLLDCDTIPDQDLPVLHPDFDGYAPPPAVTAPCGEAP